LLETLNIDLPSLGSRAVAFLQIDEDLAALDLTTRMKEGDWLLFPNMGTMNLAEYLNSGRKIQGSKVFINLKKSNSPGTKAGQINVQSFKQTCDKENVLNINLDLQNQNINFNLGSGLKGEIDLKKTFIFGN
jgi:hypothetical protein